MRECAGGGISVYASLCIVKRTATHARGFALRCGWLSCTSVVFWENGEKDFFLAAIYMKPKSRDEFDKLDALADAFEDAWRRGKPPRMEDFLKQVSGEEHGMLLRELLAIDHYYRQESADTLLDDRYLKALSSPLHLGSVLGNYELVEPLGQGGMGRVFKARHRDTNELVAIKVIDVNRLTSPRILRRFQHEIRAGIKLVHPNLVRCLESGDEMGVLYLVMEFIDGKSLHDLIQWEGRLPARRALDILSGVARGLDHIHQHGIVHRDLKPANIMIDSAGTAKVLDLGLACFRHASFLDDADVSVTRTGDILGSVGYMAPEQAFHVKDVDHRADIYSLGCVLHFVLTGKPPYKELPMARCLLNHRDAAIPSLLSVPGVPPLLDGLFQRMLAKTPGERPKSMGEVLAEFVKIREVC